MKHIKEAREYITNLLISDFSQLSDFEFECINKRYLNNVYANKHIPCVSYIFETKTDETDSFLLYIDMCVDEFRFQLGNAMSNKSELYLSVGQKFIRRDIFNTLDFNIFLKESSKQNIARNIDYLNKSCYYMNISRINNTFFSYFDSINLDIFEYVLNDYSRFVIDNKTDKMYYHYNVTISWKSIDQEYFLASSALRCFPKGIEEYISDKYTKELFNKDFKKLNKKELKLLKMYTLN